MGAICTTQKPKDPELIKTEQKQKYEALLLNLIKKLEFKLEIL